MAPVSTGPARWSRRPAPSTVARLGGRGAHPAGPGRDMDLTLHPHLLQLTGTEEVQRYGGSKVRRFGGSEVRRYGGSEVRRAPQGRPECRMASALLESCGGVWHLGVTSRCRGTCGALSRCRGGDFLQTWDKVSPMGCQPRLGTTALRQRGVPPVLQHPPPPARQSRMPGGGPPRPGAQLRAPPASPPGLLGDFIAAA